MLSAAAAKRGKRDIRNNELFSPPKKMGDAQRFRVTKCRGSRLPRATQPRSKLKEQRVAPYLCMSGK